MPLDRRRLLRSAPYLVASSSLIASSWGAPLLAAKVDYPAALLIPKTGIHAALGRSMERAAMLAQGASGTKQLMVLDTQGTAQGAIAAAKAARRGGARIMLGPLMAGEVAGVVAAAGPAIPVLTFSNDAALRESGAFILGITAAQSVTAILRYAAGRGVRRVAVGEGAGWGKQVQAAAIEAGRMLNINIAAMPDAELARLSQMDASADALPDAVLLSDVEGALPVAQALAARGVQVLGALPGLDIAPETLRVLDGIWLAAPDPAGFSGFAHAFEDRNGSPPGIITGLAYDAVRIVQVLRAGGAVDRSGLLAMEPFKGVCGAVRFREDGSAARGLAILTVAHAGLHVIASPVA